MSGIHEEARWNIEPVTSRAFAAYGRVVSGFEEECAALVQAVTEHTPAGTAGIYWIDRRKYRRLCTTLKKMS